MKLHIGRGAGYVQLIFFATILVLGFSYSSTIRAVLDLNLGLVRINHGILMRDIDSVQSGQKMLKRRLSFRSSQDYHSIANAQFSPELLLINGSFEFNGHGWRLGGPGTLKPRWTGEEAHSGLQSLVMRFDGTDVNFYQTFQEIQVQPDACYQLTAYIRAVGDIDNVGIDVWDAERGYAYWYGGATRPLIEGTRDWTPVSLDFCPSKDVTRIQIRLRRFGGYDNTVSGQVWFDNIRLNAIPSGVYRR